MIPPRPSRPLPAPKRKPANELKINRLFDSAEEMESYVKLNYPHDRIIKTFVVTQFACVIELGERPIEKGKKK